MFLVGFKIDSLGMRLILVLVSGLSKFKVGGRVFVCIDMNENTA